ncbi:MAG: nucleoside monophosphate kinase [Candidatus Nealsonbacteria bacterium]|nr:nucleoside monophosphate kinase [Candidatus Nealsonbacteria bacterium]
MQNENSKFKNKRVIILFGPPGAGKGIQAELLSDKLGLYYLETSKILEREFNNPSQKFIETEGEKFEISKEKELWLTGKLCSPLFVVEMVKKNIQQLVKEGKNLLMAGSPRTVYEAEKIIPLLKELYGKENIKVFLIEISPKETIFRNSHRRICELMRHPILYTEETEKLKNCPLDGSKLIRRKGLDDPETIKVRLEEYKNRTVPIFKIFEKEKIEIKKINGEQSVAAVFQAILKAGK